MGINKTLIILTFILIVASDPRANGQDSSLNWKLILQFEKGRDAAFFCISQNQIYYFINDTHLLHLAERDFKNTPVTFQYSFKDDQWVQEFNVEMNWYCFYNYQLEISSRVESIEDSLKYLNADSFVYPKGFNFSQLTIPDTGRLPKSMVKRIKYRQKMLRLDKYSNSSIPLDTSYNLYNPVSTYFSWGYFEDKIKNESSGSILYDLFNAQAFIYHETIPKLIELLTDTTELTISRYDHVYSFERGYLGDQSPSIHGFCGSGFNDDIFQVSGRANLLLQDITGQSFGIVSVHSSLTYLEKLQKRWVYWILSLNEE